MLVEKNIISKTLNNEKLLVTLFFFIYFLIGLYIFRDYGIPFDVEVQKFLAQNRIDYITIFFSNIFSQTGGQIKNVAIKYPEYGVAFELPALWLEKIFPLTDVRSEYFLRHFLIFLTSFFGSIFFFLIVKKRFNSWQIGLIGALLLIATPRIFAESFYNSKDIVFMYLFVISTFFALSFLEDPKKSNSFYFAFFSSFCMGVRVLGIIVPILALYFLWIKYLRSDYKKNIKFLIFVFFLAFAFFLILFWPSLWENPIKGLLHALESFKSYDHEIYNFYLGQYVHSKSIHWYYIPLWIFITTPLFILVLFLYGLIVTLHRIFSRLIKITNKNETHDLWRGPNEFQDLFFSTIIIAPIFLVIVFKSTSYSGWRHLYFIYPYIILISLVGLRTIYIKIFYLRKIKTMYFFKFFFSLFLLFNLIWLYNNHPFQNNFFNLLAGSSPHTKFEVDYWGISNKYVLEKIVREDSKNVINVTKISDTSLYENFNILTKEERQRLKYVGDINNSDYIINNNIFFHEDFKNVRKIPSNFNVYYELFVDDTLVTTIYKRDNPL